MDGRIRIVAEMDGKPILLIDTSARVIKDNWAAFKNTMAWKLKEAIEEGPIAMEERSVCPACGAALKTWEIRCCGRPMKEAHASETDGGWIGTLKCSECEAVALVSYANGE